MKKYLQFEFAIGNSNDETLRRVKSFRRAHCCKMEFVDKEGKTGTRYTKGVFRLRTPQTIREVRKELGVPSFFLKPIQIELVAAAPAPTEEDKNPLMAWLATRPTVKEVLGHAIRTVIKK